MPPKDQDLWPRHCKMAKCQNRDKVGHHHHPSRGPESVNGMSTYPCVRADCDEEMCYPGTRFVIAPKIADDGCGCVG